MNMLKKLICAFIIVGACQHARADRNITALLAAGVGVYTCANMIKIYKAAARDATVWGKIGYGTPLALGIGSVGWLTLAIVQENDMKNNCAMLGGTAAAVHIFVQEMRS